MTTLPFEPDALHLLRSPERAGVFSADETCACALYHAGPGAGFNVYRVDLGQAHDAESLHNILSRALHFPEWYGANWDALTDCMTDMSWNEADGYVLILSRAEVLQHASPEAFDMLLDVLKDTVMAWRDQGVAFWTLFIGPIADLPTLEVRT